MFISKALLTASRACVALCTSSSNSKRFSPEFSTSVACDSSPEPLDSFVQEDTQIILHSVNQM